MIERIRILYVKNVKGWGIYRKKIRGCNLKKNNKENGGK